MYVVHEPATAVHEPTDGKEASLNGSEVSVEEERVLATTVETADSILAQTRGLMFRRSLPHDYALAFRFSRAKTRDVHSLFVFVPIDVVWVADGVVTRVERLRPWRGYARAEADLIVEFPAGGADGVSEGDRLGLVDDE